MSSSIKLFGLISSRASQAHRLQGDSGRGGVKEGFCQVLLEGYRRVHDAMLKNRFYDLNLTKLTSIKLN